MQFRSAFAGFPVFTARQEGIYRLDFDEYLCRRELWFSVDVHRANVRSNAFPSVGNILIFASPLSLRYLINWAEKNGTQRIARYAPIISQTSFKRRRFTSGFFFAAKWNFFFSFRQTYDSFIRVEKYREIKFSLHFVYKYVRTYKKEEHVSFFRKWYESIIRHSTRKTRSIPSFDVVLSNDVTKFDSIRSI